MKLFSHLLQTSRHLLRMLALVPLLALASPSHGEEDIDSRDRPVEFSQAELDQILAPIALYPDTVLSQVLIAATYPIEVVQAARWASNNSSVKGADAVAKVDNKDWDPSVKALVAFPDILQRMSDDIDWTQKLGDAFLSSEERVMDSIQSLRKKAYASGSLNKVQHLKVERDQEQIIIEPAEERVVYVPVYDTRVVYGNWWWPEYPPVYWHHPTSYVQVSGFYWGPSIFIGPTFFYSSCQWHTRRVVVVDRHYVHGPRPVFYTGRSIVQYQSARPWRHEPVHRRGVAYYNNDLRSRYGSQRESYRDARAYREDRREDRREGRLENNREQQATRQRSFNDNNYTPPRNLAADRSEQLRQRIGQRNEGNPVQAATRDSRSDRKSALIHPGERSGNSDNPSRREDIKSRADRSGEQTNRGVIGASQAEQAERSITGSNQTGQDVRAQLRAQRAAQEANNLGATRPTLVQPDNSQAEREQRLREATDNARSETLRNRAMHNDAGRAEPRQSPQERPIRQERQEIQTRGNGRSDEDRPTRSNRML